jgi:hypothetical protein
MKTKQRNSLGNFLKNWALLLGGVGVLIAFLLSWPPTRQYLLPIALELVSRIRDVWTALLHLDTFTYLVILGVIVLLIPFLLDMNRGGYKDSTGSRLIIYLFGLIPLVLLLLLVRRWFF